jgi:hypothetical protein
LSFKKIKTKSTTYLVEIPDYFPGVCRTDRIVRTRQIQENQFAELCRKIKTDDFKTLRSENQKAERQSKRQRKSLET